MDIVITEWALDSYLNLKHAKTFTNSEYKNDIRPDVELLKDGLPSPHAKFQNPKFWDLELTRVATQFSTVTR